MSPDQGVGHVLEDRHGSGERPEREEGLDDVLPLPPPFARRRDVHDVLRGACGFVVGPVDGGRVLCVRVCGGRRR